MNNKHLLPGVKHVYQEGFARTRRQQEDRRLQKVLEIIKRERLGAERFLDIGCGDGAFTVKVAAASGASWVSGVDISAKATELAKKKNVKAVSLDIDLENLPYDANSFQLVYCGNLLELVCDADHLLREIHRVLAPEGKAIITFPNIAAWASRLALLLGYLPYFSRVSTHYDLGKFMLPSKKGESTGFIRLFNIQSFSELASYCGLKVNSFQGVSVDFLPTQLHLLDKILSRRSTLAFQVIALLEKD